MFPSQITTDFNIELFIVSIALTNMALRYLLLLMLHSGLSLRRDAWAISRNLPSIHHISTYLPSQPLHFIIPCTLPSNLTPALSSEWLPSQLRDIEIHVHKSTN